MEEPEKEWGRAYKHAAHINQATDAIAEIANADDLNIYSRLSWLRMIQNYAGVAIEILEEKRDAGEKCPPNTPTA